MSSIIGALLLLDGVAILCCSWMWKSRLGRIVTMALAGVGGILLLSTVYLLRCPPALRLSNNFCGAIIETPPWTLLTSVATAPALVLLWLWRTVHKDQDLSAAKREERANRFVEAVKLLADEKLEVRLGAIYSLESLAVDAEEERSRVTETLCAYLRERGLPLPEDKEKQNDWRQTTDVQAAFTVVGRLPKPATQIDLCHAKLVALGGREANLHGANLFKTNLTRISLFKADLTKASLLKANLANANLREANLTGADLTGADLISANLVDANLSGARYSSETRFPSGFDPIASGMVLRDPAPPDTITPSETSSSSASR